MQKFERSRKSSHLDTVHYEIDMLEYSFSRVAGQRELPEANIAVECFLLHYRNLIEFFSGAKHRKGSDISVADPGVWAARTLTPAELNSLQTPAQQLCDDHWTEISQFLQHCTERRYNELKDWNLEEMMDKLSPVLVSFKTLFPPTATPIHVTRVLSVQSASTTPFNVGVVVLDAKKRPESVAWRLLKRFLTLATLAIAVYVTVGCVLFPEWWFRFLWGLEFNRRYVASGLKVLLDEHFPMVIGIVLAICIIFILGTRFKVQLFRFVDKFAGPILFAALAVLFITSLVIYHTQKAQYDLIHSSEVDLLTLDNVQKFLAASNSPPRITPPVDFQYIDKDRVDELYNQIEPDLVEHERTEATTGSVKGKLGVSGTVNAEAEAGKSESSTSSFTHAAFSSERKCVELMDYILDHRSPTYYTNAQEWFLGRENAALSAQMEKNKHAPVDWSTIHPIKPIGDRPSMETPSEDEKREAERKVTQYQSELETGLKSLRGYVFVSGEFDRAIDGDTLILTETFSAKPHKVLFRIRVPTSRMPEFQSQNRLRLRMFGDVMRPLSSDGYVDVLPIALY